MKCPACDSPELRVYKTQRDTEGSILRNRTCPACGHRWYTVEVSLPPDGAMWVDRRLKRRKGYRQVTFQ